MEDLWRIVLSMQEAAKKAGVLLVTGDTKVVDHGKGDNLFINTAGIGMVETGVEINPKRAAVGDKIILNGPIGNTALLSCRFGKDWNSKQKSKVIPLH